VNLFLSNLGHLAMWKPVIDKISSRLSSSKGRHLSIGGRVCLVKSVLNNLPVYFLSMFSIPKKIATKIERQIRSFLWSREEEGRKICNVKWASVILPKSQGGLGIRSILAKNKDFFFFCAGTKNRLQESLLSDYLLTHYFCKFTFVSIFFFFWCNLFTIFIFYISKQ
jgi:hypothetical protein